MKKLLIALSLLIFSVPAFAAGGGVSGKTPLQVKKDAVDVIHLENLEVEALYWARRITVVGDLTYGELHANSERWIMGKEVRDKLFARMKEILDAGGARDLTDDERERYDSGMYRIRMILGTYKPKTPQQLKLKADREAVDVVSREIMDVEARYWAWRIAVVRDTDYSDLSAKSEKWIGKTETKKELFRKIQGLLDAGDTRPLTAEEKARHDDGKARIRAIYKVG
ncbi:MAG TPA: hypothetical protein DEQ38_09210 [Elusimicrobia bacterium]|nr:MAG: hypothetical protein A2089_01420 [Elusimicrobia bacterium GWD2_63_28]HCC48273.1 hypothetical protein [Elusimicrobiota bacterium]